eukprot:Plantae.Rhodophyta-Hildenbrandia_rubra.ctg843.p1 GENE.Plantae.Rhodophyta-Hildenbrandia_rubra.ctg843~~Plantae.Rhodophyta-Hildenbrandia_rubra.ctg843.p1  ORF type:complete len:1232 (+),score=284.01 Plantae.Rhodophyta-Hildenbrandia_rubra.ctg843:1236-4931(+)
MVMDDVKREAWREYYREVFASVRHELGDAEDVSDVNVEVANRWKAMGAGRKIYYRKIRERMEVDGVMGNRAGVAGGKRMENEVGGEEGENDGENDGDRDNVMHIEDDKESGKKEGKEKSCVKGGDACGGEVIDLMDDSLQDEVVVSQVLKRRRTDSGNGGNDNDDDDDDDDDVQIVENLHRFETGDLFVKQETSASDPLAWPRALGSRMVECTATSSGKGLAKWGDKVDLLPVVPRKKGGRGASGRKTASGVVRFSCNGREVGRLPAAVGKGLASALIDDLIQVEGRVVDAPKKVTVMSPIVLDLKFWMKKKAFEGQQVFDVGPEGRFGKKKKAEKKDASQEDKKNDKSGAFGDIGRAGLVSLLESLNLGQNSAARKKKEDVKCSMIPNLDKAPESAETFYATVEKIDKTLLKKARQAPEIDGLKSTLRDYQRLGVLWMTAREEHTDIEQNVDFCGNDGAETIAEESLEDQSLPASWARRKFLGGSSFFINTSVGRLTLDFPGGIERSPYGGILSDEMGLGKTVEVIGAILNGISDELTSRALPPPRVDGQEKKPSSKTHRGMQKTLRGGTLIVVPTSMLRQWYEEFENHVGQGQLRVVEYYGSGRTSEISVEDADVVITTYGTLASELAKYQQKEVNKKCGNGILRNIKEAETGSISAGSEDDNQDVPGAKPPLRRSTRKRTKRTNKANDLQDVGESSSDDQSSSSDDDEDFDEKSDGYDDLPAQSRRVPTEGIFSIYWWRVVLDEAHFIKGRTTKVAQAAYRLSSEKRWAVTGTPIQNSLSDAFSLIHFLRMDPYAEWNYFNSAIMKKFESSNSDSKQEAIVAVRNLLGKIMLRRRKSTLGPEGKPIVRLTKKVVQIVRLEPGEQEQEVYEALYRRAKNRFDRLLAQGNVLSNFATVLELLLRLRQTCDHPYLVISAQLKDPVLRKELDKLSENFVPKVIAPGGVKSDTAPESTLATMEKNVSAKLENAVRDSTECPVCFDSVDDADAVFPKECAHKCCRDCFAGVFRGRVQALCPLCRTEILKENLVSLPRTAAPKINIRKQWWPSAKIVATLNAIKDLEKRRKTEGNIGKCVIFSQWTSMLDLIGIALNKESINFVRLDGACAQSDRAKVLTQFAEDDESNPKTANVLLLSLKAGGVGLNLTSASTAILTDVWWNPAVEHQAMDRIHRVGQKRDVVVKRFIIQDSVEERLLEVQRYKEDVADGALASASEADRKETRLSEVKHLFSR